MAVNLEDPSNSRNVIEIFNFISSIKLHFVTVSSFGIITKKGEGVRFKLMQK